jgi:4-alpha-glucanotransferase
MFFRFCGQSLPGKPPSALGGGLLSLDDLRDRPKFPAERVDFGPAIIWKNTILDRAYVNYELLTRHPD